MDTKAYLYRQEAMKRWILLFIVSLFSLFVLGTYAIAAERCIQSLHLQYHQIHGQNG